MSANFYLIIIIESVNKETVLAISNIYGPHDFNDRLKDFRSFFDGIWLLARDFRDNIDFCNFFREIELINSPLHGRKFTTFFC